MAVKEQRIYLTTKDIQVLTGQTYRNSVNLYNTVKAAFKKKKWITISDWSKYNGDSVKEIKEALNIK